MKICFFSDIHGNLLAFDAFIRDVKRRNADLFIFGGDVFGYYYHGKEILERLRKACLNSCFLGGELVCLLGNHDKYVLDVLDGIKSEQELVKKYGNSYLGINYGITSEIEKHIRELQPEFKMEKDGLRLGFFHGGPSDPLEQRIYPDARFTGEESFLKEYDFIFCGHTHHKTDLKFGNCRIINPGSLGQQRDGKGCSYIMFDTETSGYDIFTVEFDRAALKREIDENETNPEISIRLKEVLDRKAGDLSCRKGCL